MERYFEVNEQGHNIRCKLYCQDARSVRQVVLFCHGFGGHKDNHAAARFAEKLLAKHKKAALVTFDWPCHGDDVKKKLTLADCGTYLDLLIPHVRQKFGTEDLYAYATSFGGWVTLNYILENGCDPHGGGDWEFPADVPAGVGGQNGHKHHCRAPAPVLHGDLPAGHQLVRYGAAGIPAAGTRHHQQRHSGENSSVCGAGLHGEHSPQLCPP